MSTSIRKWNPVRTLVVLLLAVAMPRLASAQSSPVVEGTPPHVVPADGWQRGLEIGGLVATFFTVGCGNSLLERQQRGDWAGYDENKNWHLGLSIATGAINLTSAWQQWHVNRERTNFEFRHVAHNALFWTNIAGLVGSTVFGIVGTQMRTDGDLDGAHHMVDAMKVTGFVSLGTALADVIFFGGHDNATIFGNKIAF